MIRIVESAPIKMTGITTLKVTFPYNESIIEIIKGYDAKVWHKSILTWEFPVTDLKKLLDDLTRYDDIELELIDGRDFKPDSVLDFMNPTAITIQPENESVSKVNKYLTQEEIDSFKVKPFDHQIDAINYGLTHDKFLLLDGCGLGKTNEIVWLAETLKHRGLIEHCLIICGVNSLKQNWKKEIRKFSNESVRVLGERITKHGKIRYDTLENRRAELLGNIEEFFVITNLEFFRTFKQKGKNGEAKEIKMSDIYKKSKTKFGMIAVDEIHKCLTGDTLVKTPNGEKQIKDLVNTSDLKVLSYNFKKKKNEYCSVSSITKQLSVKPLLELLIKQDDSSLLSLKCTEDHKIYTTNRGWVCAVNLTSDDHIKTFCVAKLLLKKKIKEEFVYDITVENNHNFYANNILVHNCTNKNSSQAENLLRIKAEHQVAATGTLITNNAISAYIPLSWTDNEKATLTDYKSTYCEYGGFGDKQIVGYKNLDVLREEIESCSIRRTLDMVRDDMPKLQIDYELVEMDDAHSKFYEDIKNGVKDEAMKVELNTSNLLALTTRLRQATSCPTALTENAVISSKLERCVELVDEIVSQGNKVVILGTFKETVAELAKMLENYKPLLCTGDIPDGTIFEGVEKFQTDPNYPVFIGTTAKTGTGITLNAAMYLIFIDTPWTWSDFDQGYSRIYRVTNVNPAFIKVLSCQDTMDERVWELINTKKDMGEYLVDGKVNPTTVESLRNFILEL